MEEQVVVNATATMFGQGLSWTAAATIISAIFGLAGAVITALVKVKLPWPNKSHVNYRGQPMQNQLPCGSGQCKATELGTKVALMERDVTNDRSQQARIEHQVNQVANDLKELDKKTDQKFESLREQITAFVREILEAVHSRK